jgi:arylsulfatase A-like enzyme
MPVRAEKPKPTIRASGQLNPPNVLFLIADDHRFGTMGVDGDRHGATPRLDAFARQGVRFTRAYCNAPVCTASRQSFLTGRLPHAVGVTLLQTPLPEKSLTLAEWLGNLGYDTAAFGKMHFNGPLAHGFQERLDIPQWNQWLHAHPPDGGDKRRPWRPFADPASVWLNAGSHDSGLPQASMDSTYFADQAIEYLNRRRDDPFFLVVSFYDPHSPFRYPRELAGKYRPDEFTAPPVSEEDQRHRPLLFKDLTDHDAQGIQAAYYTSVNYLDSQVGRVLDALEASGQASNTLVVYLGDNGYMLGEHGRFEKHCFYEPAVRVPLLMRWAGHLPAGRTVDVMVEFVDIFPTVLELLGIASPGDLHGNSLGPLMRGAPGAIGRDVVFSEYLENEEAMVRSERFKLIVGTGNRKRLDGYVTADPTPGPYMRLFDEAADPGETKDLSREPAMRPVLENLLDRLYLRLATTRDGTKPVPPGLSKIEAIHWCLIPRDPPPPESPAAEKK